MSWPSCPAPCAVVERGRLVVCHVVRVVALVSIAPRPARSFHTAVTVDTDDGSEQASIISRPGSNVSLHGHPPKNIGPIGPTMRSWAGTQNSSRASMPRPRAAALV
jgi:hypothetical protein